MNFNSKTIVAIITVTVILLYTGIIVGWNIYTPHKDLVIQAPGADNRPEEGARSIYDVNIGASFMEYNETTSELTGKWTNFRGAQSNNIVVDSETLNLSSSDFPTLWNVETGEGYAAPVIYNGRAYFLDYDEALNSDALRCFDLVTGTELWRRWYRVPMKRNHGFSRTVPVIGEGYIITIGPQGHVMCCDPITGDLKWSLDMQKEYGTIIPNWYTGQCPLVDGNTVVLAPAGDEILMAGFDCLTGEMVWSTPNTVKYKMSHSSIMLMTLGGKKMYVYAGVGGMCGVSAEEADLGTLLWETSRWFPTTIAPSPVQIANNRFFMCAGYGTGGALFQIDRQGAAWTVSVTEQYKPSEGLSSEQQTPIFYNNMLISVTPKDGGSMRHRIVCYSPTNLRTPIWTSGADERIVSGPYIIINSHLFAFNEEGELYVYEIKQQSMKLIKRQTIIDGKDAWGPLAYADGILMLGDAYSMIALKISE